MILTKGTEMQEVALANAPEQKAFKVERISGSRTQSLRLVEMGVMPGAEVSVVQRSHGMMVVRVGGTRLGLARNVADAILVK